MLRRTAGEEESSGSRSRLTFDKLVIDLDAYELMVDGKRIDTPPKELELLHHLTGTFDVAGAADAHCNFHLIWPP